MAWTLGMDIASAEGQAKELTLMGVTPTAVQTEEGSVCKH